MRLKQTQQLIQPGHHCEHEQQASKARRTQRAYTAVTENTDRNSNGPSGGGAKSPRNGSTWHESHRFIANNLSKSGFLAR